MKERLLNILKNPLTIPIVVGVTSFGTGVGAGYILANRRKVKIHDAPAQMKLDFNINDVIDPLNKLKKDREEKEEPEKPGYFFHPEVEEFLEEKLAEPIVIKTDEEEEIEPIHSSVTFAENNTDWDYEEELKHRTPLEPYIIHKDEFWAEEEDYTQTTLTYYAGDNIMADEDDTPVYSYEKVIGPLRFGHGSGDPNVFYVRNDKRKAEYEILLHTGLFSQEVLGLEIENNARVQDLKHSTNRKFKME